jgi:hypothetical protein
MRRFLLGSIAVVIVSSACARDEKPRVTARQITSRTDLIGGPGALGEIGDYLLANERIRAIVQGPGYSRGFGIYGGSLIDADLVRPYDVGSSAGGRGYDHFSELFPAVFLKAMKPKDNGIRIVESTDGSGSATIEVSGSGDEFVFIAKRIDELLVDSSKLLFKNEYKLSPGKRYVEITTTIINQGDEPVEFPGTGILSLSPKLAGFTMPVGDVILFGSGNDVFAPVAGFDLRFTLEALYRKPTSLPKLPGLVTPFLATRGDHVSYGFTSGITDPNLSFVKRTGYEDANIDDLVVPFIASSFTGAYYGAAPAVLESRKSFSFKKYLIVGSGDVASIRDVYHEIHGTKVGMFSAVVRDEKTQALLAGVSVMTFDASGSPYNQHTSDGNGDLKGTYAPGQYTYRVISDGRFTTEPVRFEVVEGRATYVDILLPQPGYVSIRIHAEDGRPMPAKCSLVGQYSASAAGFDPKEFLYSYKWGERQRQTDLIPDTDDPSTREYVEDVIIAATGEKTQPERVGAYRVVCSRGIEYDTTTSGIVVREGEISTVDVVLHHVVNTDGWVSGDYHMHSINSVDSAMPIGDRLGHAAAEGLDIACSTDHNFVTDYTPTILRAGLKDWIQGMIGLEMTTLEIGHFNGFPLSYDPGPITKGSFAWSGRPPGDIFSDLRGLGRFGRDNTIIQVNHPRDTILGYFQDYHLNPDTGEVEDSTSLLQPIGPEFGKDRYSTAFDAIELFNGKRFDLLRSYRVPDVLPPPPLPMDVPPAGTVLRDKDGKVAFPGALEDWYALLNKGLIYTATGNSDSHNSLDEPAYPRTYTPVSDDRVGAISEIDVVNAIKNQRAMVTNGPFIRVSVSGRACHNQKGDDLQKTACGMGEVASTMGASVKVDVSVDVAPWIKIDTVRILRGGEVAETVRGDNASLASVSRMITATGDTFVVVEVEGAKSMWPVLTPLEVPPIQVSDALNSIGGAFGLSLQPFGNLAPQKTFITRPFGFTNPVFVDANGDGLYSAPGVSQVALRAAETAPRVNAKLEENSFPSIVKMFMLFDGHAH